MRALLHTAKTRRNVLLLFLFTVLSLAGLVRLISYNSEKRKTAEQELEQKYTVINNIEQIRSSLGETESYLQSFMLTGDVQWKTSLSATHDRVLKVLNETSLIEADPMQQHKFSLVKKALEQKIAFQQHAIMADSVSPEMTTAMGFYGLNRRLTTRIQSPLDLITEREQLLLQRKTDSIQSAATQAKFITIFSAIFLYLLILYALWQLRNRVQPGPAARMDDEEEDEIYRLQAASLQTGFRGVFPIRDNRDDKIRRQEGSGLVRVLWSKEELEKNLGQVVAKTDQQERDFRPIEEKMAAELVEEETVPEWKAAGLPEELSLHFEDHDHFLPQAVNSNYYQPAPVYNRQPGAYVPAGSSSLRVMPAPVFTVPDFSRFPAQEAPRFELSALIQEILNPFYAQADEKNIRLLHTIDPALPNFLSGDAKKLSNILHSIIANAMRFTYKGYIQFTITGLNIQADQAEIAFSVADTGKGIDADQMHDLLHGNGSKLPALYHAKKLAESQQNQLMVHSTEEDGTVCCVIGTYRF